MSIKVGVVAVDTVSPFQSPVIGARVSNGAQTCTVAAGPPLPEGPAKRETTAEPSALPQAMCWMSAFLYGGVAGLYPVRLEIPALWMSRLSASVSRPTGQSPAESAGSSWRLPPSVTPSARNAAWSGPPRGGRSATQPAWSGCSSHP